MENESLSPYSRLCQVKHNYWILNQNEDGISTEDSDVEDDSQCINNCEDKDSITELEQFQSTINCCLNQVLKKQKKKLLPCNQTSGDTETEFIALNNDDFSKIVYEELGIRNDNNLNLKIHEASSTTKTKHTENKQISDIFNVHSDDTDVSDLSKDDNYTSKKKRYTMKKLKKSVVTKISEDTDEEECHDNDNIYNTESSESEVEVNMKDYYIIRHENTPKAISGPFTIDCGNIQHYSSMKCYKTMKSKKTIRIPVICQVQYDTSSTDDDVSNSETKLVTYQDFLKANGVPKNQFKETKRTTNIIVNECSSSSNGFDSDSYCTESVDIANNSSPTPIIRFIEMDGLQGAVGVLCQPTSPTMDDVHGIRFLDHNSLDNTEQFSTSSGLDADIGLMEIVEPATDDEDMSDFELDVQAQHEHKVYQTNTAIDENIYSSENLVGMERAVTFMQLLKESEEKANRKTGTLSKSVSCHYPEREFNTNISRKFSGDIGKLNVDSENYVGDDKFLYPTMNERVGQQKMFDKKKF